MVVRAAAGAPTVTQARTVIGSGTIGSPVASGITVGSGSVRQARVISSGVPTNVQSGYVNAGVTRMAPQVISGAPVVMQARQVGPPGPTYTQSAYEVKHKDDPQLQNLKELRKTSGLKNVPVGDGLQGFKKMAVDGKLTREQFLAAYATILEDHQIEVPEDAVKNAVFDLFDRDDNNVVDMMEVICGVSLLCSGGEDDKIHAVFEIFDENGDGFISMDEMFKFLSSVFKVVLTPNVMNVMNSMGVTVESAEDLASVTALECFKTADLNHDGKLSVGEFKNWFYAPRNDPSFLFSPVRKLLA